MMIRLSRQLLQRCIVIALLLFCNSCGLGINHNDIFTMLPQYRTSRVILLSTVSHPSHSMDGAEDTSNVPQFTSMSLDEAIMNRYSCKKFRRYEHCEMIKSNTTALTQVNDKLSYASDPSVIQRAIESLNLARRTPSAFNTQPYRVVLVTSWEQKLALSQYCLGPNKQKVLDSDCTAIFLADKQIVRSFPKFRQLIQNIGKMKQRGPIAKSAMLKMQFYITLFSSGYPFPRLLSAPISFMIRTCIAWINFFTKWFYPLPSLANAETWSSKQAMMVAMTYMLACTSRGLATAPMEGINAGGIRKVINAPSRYSIPIIVSTGLHYEPRSMSNTNGTTPPVDDRYKFDELMFGNTFGSSLKNIA